MGVDPRINRWIMIMSPIGRLGRLETHIDWVGCNEDGEQEAASCTLSIIFGCISDICRYWPRNASHDLFGVLRQSLGETSIITYLE